MSGIPMSLIGYDCRQRSASLYGVILDADVRSSLVNPSTEEPLCSVVAGQCL